jgi:vacuolar-type H+-ATPase subunit I/STV1
MRPKECKYCGNDAFYGNTLSRAFFCGSRYVYATENWVQEKNTKCMDKTHSDSVSEISQNHEEAILELTKAVEELRLENERLGKEIEKLRKRHPTQEEALAQYHWLKANSKRNETRTIQE